MLALGTFIALFAAATAEPKAGDASAQPTVATPKPTPGRAVATFAGGCFWCMESELERVKGIRSVTSGYTGGHTKNPSYEDVSSGKSGHAEAVQILYDSGKVPYERLLELFWENVDPFDTRGQFCDHGSQYRTAIFYHDDAQRQAAEASKAAVEARFNRAVVTEIEGRALVFVKKGDRLYRPVAVVLGGEDGGRIEIVRGLSEGAEVVTTGAFLLKTEILKESIGAGCCEEGTGS